MTELRRREAYQQFVPGIFIDATPHDPRQARDEIDALRFGGPMVDPDFEAFP